MDFIHLKKIKNFIHGFEMPLHNFSSALGTLIPHTAEISGGDIPCVVNHNVTKKKKSDENQSLYEQEV